MFKRGLSGILSANETVIFNVGGQIFEIASSLLSAYPSSKLYQMCRQAAQTNKEIFLDHNPAAFSVIIDFLRYGGKLLVPQTVCKEVVLLQLGAFGLPVPDIIKDDAMNEDLPPSYSIASAPSKEDAFNSSVPSLLLYQTVSNAMDTKVSTLVENYIHPLIMEHARSGHPKFEIFMFDSKVRKEDVADTIADDLPIEWIFLTDKDLRFESIVTSPGIATWSGKSKTSPSMTLEDNLALMIQEFEGISMSQREKLLSAIEKSRNERLNLKSHELPDVSYLIKSSVLPKLEEAVKIRSNVHQCRAERKDLTVRHENEYGLLESANILAVKLIISIT